MAGTIPADSKTQANNTARQPFKQLAHRAKDFTNRYADILTQTAEGDATPSATQQPKESTTPVYGGPPKTMEALLERHKLPPQTEPVTQTQEQDDQTTAKAGGQREPGWSIISTERGASGDIGTKVGAASTQPSTAKGHANEHGCNIDQDDGGGANGFGTPTRLTHSPNQRRWQSSDA